MTVRIKKSNTASRRICYNIGHFFFIFLTFNLEEFGFNILWVDLFFVNNVDEITVIDLSFVINFIIFISKSGIAELIRTDAMKIILFFFMNKHVN